MSVNQMRTPNIAMIAASCGFDALFVDMEHNPTTLETAAAVTIAALGVGITPIVRISSHEKYEISRVLDLGAQGIMVPHVGTAQQARDVVEACLLYSTVMQAARAHGKSMGVGGVRNDPQFQTELLQLGVRYLTCGSDVGYVVSGGRADVAGILAMPLS